MYRRFFFTCYFDRFLLGISGDYLYKNQTKMIEKAEKLRELLHKPRHREERRADEQTYSKYLTQQRDRAVSIY